MVTLIAFGANNIDQYYAITHWPHPGDKAVIHPQEAVVGGMIGNAASVYAALGSHAVSFDFLPPGEETELILSSMKASGVTTDFIDINPNHELSKCLIILKDGERIVYVIGKQNPSTSLTPSQISFLSDSHLFYSNPIDFHRLVNKAEVIKAGCKIVFDVEYNSIINIPEPLEFLRHASMLFINQDAHAYLEGLNSNYLEHLQIDPVIITLGDQGSLLYHHQKIIQIPACPTTVVDTTGAGDTHHAAFLHAIYRHYPIEKAARFASAAASLSITGFGPRSGQHTETEVLDFAKKQRYEL